MDPYQHTCQCFEVWASFDHLSMSPRLVTRLCISASGGSSLPGLPARSVLSWKCWPLSLQPKLSYFWTKIMFGSLHGYTKRMYTSWSATWRLFNGILNTDLPALPLIAPNIRLRYTSVKMARLTNFDRKGVQIFFTNKPLTLKMWLPFRIVRFY